MSGQHADLSLDEGSVDRGELRHVDDRLPLEPRQARTTTGQGGEAPDRAFTDAAAARLAARPPA